MYNLGVLAMIKLINMFLNDPEINYESFIMDKFQDQNQAKTIIKAIAKVREDIMQKFYDQQSKPDHTIMMKWVVLMYMPQLNEDEKMMLPFAIETLKKESLIETRGIYPASVMALTQEGYSYIRKIHT